MRLFWDSLLKLGNTEEIGGDRTAAKKEREGKE